MLVKSTICPKSPRRCSIGLKAVAYDSHQSRTPMCPMDRSHPGPDNSHQDRNVSSCGTASKWTSGPKTSQHNRAMKLIVGFNHSDLCCNIWLYISPYTDQCWFSLPLISQMCFHVCNEGFTHACNCLDCLSVTWGRAAPLFFLTNHTIAPASRSSDVWQPCLLMSSP